MCATINCKVTIFGSCVRSKELACRVAVRVLSTIDFHRLGVRGDRCARSRAWSRSEAGAGGAAEAGVCEAATPAARRRARGSRGPCCAPRGGRRSPRGGAGSRHPRSGTTMCPTAKPSTTSSIGRCEVYSTN